MSNHRLNRRWLRCFLQISDRPPSSLVWGSANFAQFLGLRFMQLEQVLHNLPVFENIENDFKPHLRRCMFPLVLQFQAGERYLLSGTCAHPLAMHCNAAEGLVPHVDVRIKRPRFYTLAPSLAYPCREPSVQRFLSWFRVFRVEYSHYCTVSLL